MAAPEGAPNSSNANARQISPEGRQIQIACYAGNLIALSATRINPHVVCQKLQMDTTGLVKSFPRRPATSPFATPQCMTASFADAPKTRRPDEGQGAIARKSRTPNDSTDSVAPHVLTARCTNGFCACVNFSSDGHWTKIAQPCAMKGRRKNAPSARYRKRQVSCQR